MSTPNDNKRQQLISKLKEMFQMDQADLDFGALCPSMWNLTSDPMEGEPCGQGHGWGEW
jgi:hypothetical protein